MASYLDDLPQYNSEIQVRFAELAKEARILLEASKDAQTQSDDVNWWQLLITGSNDSDQTTDLRLTLLTLLVDNARLNEVPLIDVFGLYQTLSNSTVTASQWGLIGGNINDQADLIAKFNTYLPLTAGATKPLTGDLYFATDGLGVDVITEGDTLNIGASAGVVQFGADAEVKLNIISEGAWQGTNIGVTYGGLGSLDFASGTDGQAIVKSGAGYAFYTIPAIPSLAGYIKADGTVPMTADLRFPISKGIDTAAAGTLYIGQNNATGVQIFQNLSLTNVVSGNWQATPVDLEFGGTGANLAPPSSSSFFIYDSGTSSFATIGDNLSYSAGSVALAQVVTGTNRWRANVIEVAYGGTGLNAVGAEGDVLTVVAGVPAWAAFSALTNPMDDAGQMIYGGVAGMPTKLEPNATSTNKFLRSVSSGNPSWEILVAADIPTITQSQVSGLSTALANKLSTVLTDGYMLVGNAANAAVGVAMYGDATLDNTGSLLIADEAVTFAKMQNITATTLVGRWSAGDGPMQEIIISTGLNLSITGELTATGGGGGTPGGSDTQLQYNNAGAFGGITGATTNGTIVTLTSPSVTTSLVTASTSFNLLNTTATTINFGGAANTMNIGGSGAAINIGGGATAAELRFLEPSGSGTNYTGFKAPALAGNVIYTLPTADGTSGQVLSTNGSGTLSWAAAGSGTVTSVAALTLGTTGSDLSSTVANGTTTPVITLNVPDAGASARGVITTGTQTIAGAKTFSGSTTFSLASGGAIILSGTGSTSSAAISFTGATMRWINFGAAGAAAPTITGARSVGTKLVFSNTFASGSANDFAIGLDTFSFWFTLQNNSAAYSFQWYGGASSVMQLVGNGQLTLTPVVQTSGAIKGFAFTGPLNTGQSSTIEISSFSWTSNGRQWSTGAIGTQREFLITAPTYSFVGASTITNAATFAIAGAPVAGTNATLTNSYALWVQGGISKFDGEVRLTQTVTTETVVSDTTVTMVINGTTYKLLARA